MSKEKKTNEEKKEGGHSRPKSLPTTHIHMNAGMKEHDDCLVLGVFYNGWRGGALDSE